MEQLPNAAKRGGPFQPINRDGCTQRFMESFLTWPEVGVVLFDNDFQIVETSDMVCSIFGTARANMVHRHGERWLLEAGIARSKFPFDQSLLTGSTFRRRIFDWQRGKKHYKLTVDGEILGKDNRQAGAYVRFRDVTSRTQLEEQVRRSDRLHMVGQIAAGTGHEIRNPLTAVKGFMQLLDRSMQDKGLTKEKGFVRIVLSELERVNNLVSEFLLLSKQKEPKFVVINPNEVLEDIMPIINNEAILNKITVYYESEEEIPPIKVDKEMLKQVCLNLSKNAIEAMSPSGGILTILLGFCEELTEHISLQFKDTGTGISTDKLGKIFEPFFTTKEQGTGLGLPVCRSIVNDFGGDITIVTSEQGSTFKVFLPYVVKEAQSGEHLQDDV